MLLRPSPVLNQVVLGVLGRAQQLYEVECCGVIFLSNHWHGLFRVRDALQLARFMQFVDGNISREVGRPELHDWPHGIWADRYHAIPVSDEEEAQVGRLKYLLAHGVKEGLVGKVTEWPGIHAAHATFVAAFRDAADQLKAGDRLARFPVGSFPPGLPFVRGHPAMPP